jgi:O-methyltransferase
MTVVDAGGLDSSIAPALYLDLLKKCLTRYLVGESYVPFRPVKGSLRYWPYMMVKQAFERRGIEMMRRAPFDPAARAEGRDWPADAETMVGLKRLDNIQMCVTDVIQRGVPGDLIETGVWRGGSCIFMRAILKAYGDASRRVWVADSFEGLPKPNPEKYPKDAGDRHWKEAATLAVPIEAVRENFAKYGLLDDQVSFLKGWFRETLPTAPIDRLAVLRLDGDMYESTMDALQALYSKVSPGGYVIVDDFGLPGCRAAIEDFRRDHRINDPIREIDWLSVFWQKTA